MGVNHTAIRYLSNIIALREIPPPPVFICWYISAGSYQPFTHLRQVDKPRRPAYLTRCTDEMTEEQMLDLPEVHNYKNAISTLHNISEDINTLNDYKEAVKKLLLPNS